MNDLCFSFYEVELKQAHFCFRRKRDSTAMPMLKCIAVKGFNAIAE